MRASTCQFFAAVHERNRDTAAEEPTVASADRNENDVVIPSNIPVTPDIPEAEATETETRSPRTFLPSGSPSRPTATATCQTRTWVQCISEGQINEPTQEDTHSLESSATETSVLAERVPEELGQECRVLHPFEIPGVRFPTDATPPNQRILAEKDALVELIQTTEYLEDTPTWRQIDYWLYPSWYGDPFYRGRGRWEWFSERPAERSNGGLGRGFSHENGKEIRGEISQIHNARDQQNRQEDEWSVPASIERREGNTLRRELQRAPPASPHSEDRLFTDWISLDSPQTRTSPTNVSARDIEQDGNQPNNQTIQSGSEPAQIEVMGNALHDSETSSSTCQQLDQVGVRLIDVGINTSEIELRSQREGAEEVKSDEDNVWISFLHVEVTPPTGAIEQVHVPHINLSTSRYVSESPRGSHMSTYDIGTQQTTPIKVEKKKNIRTCKN